MARAEQMTLSRRLFNPNFYHAVNEMRDITRRFLWFYGGSSSAKTYSTVQAELIQGCLIEASNTIVFRKVSSTIKKSIKNDFETVIKNMGLDHYFTIQEFTIKCYNGSYIDFSGMDDAEKIKGISSYKRVHLEEITEFDFADFKQVRKRLRGVEGQQIICTFNPIDEDHWIKTEVFDKHNENVLPVFLDQNQTATISPKFADLGHEYTSVTHKWEGNNVEVDGVVYPPNMVVMKSTYKNNFWVVGSPCEEFGFYDIQTLADFEDDRINHFDFFRIYALGEWGKLNIGGEMYKAFNVQNHTGKFAYDSSLPLHLSFDENVNPYMTLHVYQAEGHRVRQIDEICLKDPLNTLADTMKEFRARYGNNGQTVFIYGDATSKKQDVKLEKGKNFYTLIENELASHNYPYKNRVSTSNPNVSVRCNWINEVLRTGLGGIDFMMDSNCTYSIADFKYLKEASDGTKHKEKTRNPVTKVTYEKYGHNTDATEYFLCEYFDKEFYKYQNPSGERRAVTKRRRVRKGY